jgi:hypothetical protein
MVFFWGKNDFVQFSLFETKCAFLLIESTDEQAVFLSKTQFSQGKKVLDAPASNIDGFLFRDPQFLQHTWIGLFATKCEFLHLTNPDGQAVFFSKNEFNSHRETICLMLLLLTEMLSFQEMLVFLQLSWIGLFGTKYNFLPLENTDWQAVFLSETNSSLTEKQCCICTTFFFFSFYYSYVHTRLGSFLPPAPTPSLTTHSAPSLSPSPPQYPAETILPFFSNFVVERV